MNLLVRRVVSFQSRRLGGDEDDDDGEDGEEENDGETKSMLLVLMEMKIRTHEKFLVDKWNLFFPITNIDQIENWKNDVSQLMKTVLQLKYHLQK